MREVFTTVLEAGIYGSVIVLAVLLFRALVRKTPGKWLCLLWLLAFLRLAIPFRIESSFSLQPDVEAFGNGEASEIVLEPGLPETDTPVQNMVPAVPNDAELPEDVTVSYGDAITPPAVSDDPVVPDTPVATIAPDIADPPAQTHIVTDWLAVCGWVWLAGCACFCGYGLISYLRLKRRVREAVRCADGAWECAGLETAFILGFLRPRIYIPMGTRYGRDFILTHERGHIARGDHWWKLLGYLILAVHWYNPLVWVAYQLLCRDMERACDERVVRHMTLDERKAYSTALLSCSTNRAHFAACPVAFGEISVKGRIQNVLNYRKPGFWVICVAVIALIFVAVCLMTSPAQPDLNEYLQNIDSRLTAGNLNTDIALTDLTTERELQELKALLKALRYDPDPIREDTSGEDIWMYYWLMLECGEEDDYILFTSDFSSVWAEIGGKRTPMYKVENPETVKEFFDTAVLAVVNRPTSGEPFATADEYWAWTQGIYLDAVQDASIRLASPRVDNSVSTSLGKFSLPEFEEFLKLLNALPEEAFTPKQVIDSTFNSMRTNFGRNGGLSVTIMDGVNQMKGLIRLENDTVELVLTQQLDYLDDMRYLDTLRCWVIEDDALLDYLKEMYVHPPIVTLWGWYGFDPVERCREALELLNARESYHILMEGDFGGNDRVLTEKTEQEFWKQGADRAVRVYPSSDTATWWLKEENGTVYEKLDCETWVSPDMQPYDWQESDFPEADKRLRPWTAQFVWEDARITFENWEVLAGGETITLRVVYGEYEFLSRFAFDDSGTLTEIVNTFVSYQGEPYPGTLTITVLETMEPVDTTLAQEQEDASGKTLLSSTANGCVQSYRINGDGDPRFGYVIKDKKGNVKRTENGLAKEPLITELDGNIVKISMRTGTGMSTNWAVYYDAENQWFSQKYHAVLAEYGRWIAVYGEDQNTPGITVLEMFGFDTPLKTVPLTGLEPGITEPINAVSRSADGKLSVTYKIGQSEHTMMIDMALGSEMTDLELLALCRSGLDRFQRQDHYSLLIERKVTTPGQYTPETEKVYQIGGDYYRHRNYRDGDWRVEEVWLQKDGEQFTRSYRDVHEGTVMPVDTGWVREAFVPEQPWACTFDFDAQKVTLLSTGEESGRKTVELLVAGSPGSNAPDVKEYTVRFILEASGVPHRAVLSYGDVKETVHYNSASEDMILMTFEAMYSQAVSAQE